MSAAETFLNEKGTRTETALAECLARCDGAPPRLIEAMRYSLLAPAKRLRPALVLGACEFVCGDDAPAMPAACAIEMIHAYSLIHDDLPSMDNDAIRRGQPSCHVAYGEALAILAGDTLLTLAFDVLADAGNLDVIREVAQAAGPHGMAGGQVLDLEAENQRISLDALQAMHRMKTGALIRSAVRVGAILGGVDADSLTALSRYGDHLGLAFQITDDLLDVTGHETSLGKTVGKDARQAKSTFPALLGLDQARQQAERAVGEALAALEPFGRSAAGLRELAQYTIARDR